MSKNNQRKQSNKDNARKAYQQGYSDAQSPSQHFRWRKHPYLNEYRLGYAHGTKKLKSLNKEPKKFSFIAWFKSILIQ